MSNLTNLEFVELYVSSKNYLSWVIDAEIRLTSMNLGETIEEGNQRSP